MGATAAVKGFGGPEEGGVGCGQLSVKMWVRHDRNA